MNPDLWSAVFILRGSLAGLSRGAARKELSFRPDQSLRHEAEVLGIPASEIGRALVDGDAWSLELPLPDGSTVELFPQTEPLLLGREPRFLVDGHLGALARELRLLGLDAEPRGGLRRDEFVETAIADSRIVLTRDRGLLFHRALARANGEAMLLASTDRYEQLLQVSKRYGLLAFARPLSRCAACGLRLEAVPKATILGLVPAIVSERYDDFRRCPGCGKVYWKGDHARSIEPTLRRLAGDAGQA